MFLVRANVNVCLPTASTWDFYFNKSWSLGGRDFKWNVFFANLDKLLKMTVMGYTQR